VTPRLVLATANAAKARELSALVDGLGYTIWTLADYPGVTLPPEVETSYADNARRKAEAAVALTRAVALGDDSGLEVEALGGRPGPASARYGGPGLSDAARAARLLAEVGDAAARTARFRCVLALAAPWGEEAIVEGVVDGVLTVEPRGAGGFGYDPIFLIPALGRTLAELSPDDKHRISHRGRAVAAARPILQRWAVRAATSV
jgi:XTP/dITP diphosphohydrolase